MLLKVLASEDVYYALQSGFNFCVGIWISEATIQIKATEQFYTPFFFF